MVMYVVVFIFMKKIKAILSPKQKDITGLNLAISKESVQLLSMMLKPAIQN